VAPSGASASPSAGRRRGRLLPAILALLAIVVVIVIVVVATAPAPTKVVLRNVVYTDVQQASSALKQLVAENTK
jgi:peptidoglycan/LPS O-acetylase OafA/YrhL